MKAGGRMRPLVVVGDALLDVDVEGTATRLSPDAPVPVVDVQRERRRPGGAALAALLAARSTLRPVVLVTTLADDAAASSLTDMLAGVDVVASISDGSTVCKTRVRAGGQSLVRLDTGDARAPRRPAPGSLDAIDAAAAVLVADYGRGLTSNPQIRCHISKNANVVWDPHPRGARPVEGARLVTPNAAEAMALGAPPLPDAAEVLRERWQSEAVAVTDGPRGAVLADTAATKTIPVHKGQTGEDTCGAGDRFAAAAALALADGAGVHDAVARAVDQASRFVAAGGLRTVDPNPRTDRDDAYTVAEGIAAAGGRLVATGGCFDLLHPGHIALLKQARSLGDALIVCLNSDASVRRRKGPGRPVVPEQDRARMVSELPDVDGVLIFDEDDPSGVLERLRPDVWVKGGDYRVDELPEAAVVQRHGGEVVIAGLIDGYSTSKLVAAANGHG